MAALAPGTVQLHPFAWNQKLTKYVKDGQLEKVMQLFQQMQEEGTTPDKFTFVQARVEGIGTISTNVKMLGECSVRCHLEVWSLCSAMTLGCVKCSQGQKALELFQQMQQEGV
ncbi:unnamed protein product [Sphagnum tenellum]